MKILSLLCALLLALSMTGCAAATQHKADAAENVVLEGEEKMQQLKIKINGHNFTALFYDNKAADKLKTLLPLQLKMRELNGNEKYCNLPEALPVQTQKVGKINAGDIMLFGNDCLVVFYKSFSTPYSYTRLARIENTPELEKAVGHGNVQAEFSLLEEE